jgi:leucokinin receptor
MEEPSMIENSSLELNITNSSSYFDQPLYSPPLSIVLVLSLFYGAISLVAVLGNSTVILIVLTSRRMQRVNHHKDV